MKVEITFWEGCSIWKGIIRETNDQDAANIVEERNPSKNHWC